MNALQALFRLRPRKRLNVEYLAALIASILLALLVGALIMGVSGHDPLAGYKALLQGSLGSPRAIGDTAAKTATLCLTALAMAVAAKAGIFNVGGEGQLYLGAMASALVGGYITGLPGYIGIPLCLLSATLAGGLFALFPAWLKVRLKVNEVVTTIMLNSAAIYFCAYLTNGPLKTAEKGIAIGTVKVDAAYMFPRLVKLSTLTTSIYISAAIALLIWYLMKRTSQGFEMRLTGENERFARYSGIRSGKLALISMLISGAICGAVGMFEVFGLHKRFVTTVSSEFYFDGMLVAMIMRYDPIGIALMSVFFAILKIGATGMETVGIPSETILIVQSVIIFFMAAEDGIMQSIKARLLAARARREAAAKIGREADA